MVSKGVIGGLLLIFFPAKITIKIPENLLSRTDGYIYIYILPVHIILYCKTFFMINENFVY